MPKTRPLIFIGVLVAGAAAAWMLLPHEIVRAAPTAASAPAAVPVSAVPAKVQDVKVYLNGLGTVEAFNKLVVKSQVSGTLIALPAKEGQEVRKGDVLAEIDPRPYQSALDQAVAKRAEDVAQLQSAELDLRRYQDLAKRDFAPVQQVDDQQAMVSKLTAAIQADTAAIESARLNLEFCTIHAPFNGRVSLYQTDIGNLIEVTTQTGILTLAQDKPIAVVFTLPEAQLPPVQRAMAQGTLPVFAFDNTDKSELAAGTLMAPNNAIDTSTGTIQLKASFPNENDSLWPGEFVNARLQVSTLRSAVVVPLAAVQHGPDGLFVFTVRPDDTVQQQPVQVSYQDNAIAVVSLGLHGGETVVLTGQSRLTPGARVAVNNSPSTSTAQSQGGYTKSRS
jgi:membrane fusion protein, multidrug efflux system